MKFCKDKSLEKFWKTDLSRSLLSKPLISVSNVVEVHGVLYGTWWCDPPGGVEGQNTKSSSYLKIFKA